MRIYADTASLADIERLNEHPWVSGFTTNPTIFKAAGVTDPEAHAKAILALTDKPVSIDGPPQRVWDLAPNAIPKIIAQDDLPEVHAPVNHTAIFLPGQIKETAWYQPGDIISIFVGRIMDTGHSMEAVYSRAKQTKAQLLWASTRELFQLKTAAELKFDIITVTPALIDRMDVWWGMPLESAMELTLKQFEADRVPW